MNGKIIITGKNNRMYEYIIRYPGEREKGPFRSTLYGIKGEADKRNLDLRKKPWVEIPEAELEYYELQDEEKKELLAIKNQLRNFKISVDQWQFIFELGLAAYKQLESEVKNEN